MSTSAPSASMSVRVARAIRAAGRAERDVWVSIVRWATRRPRVPTGATGFTYHAPVLMVLVIFLVLSVVEVVILDLIVHPWPWVRIPLLIVGVWGFVWMLGLMLGYITCPHAVGPDGVRARQGPAIDIDLPWESVAAVSRARDVAENAPRVRDEAHGPTLALRMQNETNVLVELERPAFARIGGDEYEIMAVRLWSDDLDGFLAAVRTHIP